MNLFDLQKANQAAGVGAVSNKKGEEANVKHMSELGGVRLRLAQTRDEK